MSCISSTYFLLNVQTKFLLFPHTVIFSWLQSYHCTEFKESGKILQDTPQKKPQTNNFTYLSNCIGKSNMCPFAYSWTLFLQFTSISHTIQIIFASWTYSWSIRKTKCFNISLKFFCPVPLNSEGGDITTGLYKAQRHAVTKRYPRPVDWPNRVKFHKEVVFRNVLHYRVDLRHRVQRKKADIVCTLKLPSQRFSNLW